MLWQGNPWEGREYQVHTLENMVPAQYHTGVTTIHSFQSDGTFVPLNASDKLGGETNRLCCSDLSILRCEARHGVF